MRTEITIKHEAPYEHIVVRVESSSKEETEKELNEWIKHLLGDKTALVAWRQAAMVTHHPQMFDNQPTWLGRARFTMRKV